MIFNLTDTELWWPQWDRGVSFTWFAKRIIGHGTDGVADSYRFYVDTQLAELYNRKTGFRMPMSTAELQQRSTGTLFNYSSFAILLDGRVQINRYTESGYAINILPIDDLVFTGPAYDPSED